MTVPPIPNAYWLPGGRVLAGEYPGHWVAQVARERIGRLLDAGIRSFLDLTEESDPLQPYDEQLHTEAASRGVDVVYVRLGVRDMDVPAREQMSRILDHIDAELEAGRKVYVHCWGGIGRTGTAVGCHLVRSGRSGAEALATIAELWQGVSEAKRRDFPESPQTRAQRAFVEAWIEDDGAEEA
ncbi:MAG TPA: hypothetical protein VFT04_04425 [Gemmatimonadales bacterium]|nr:hypothetical protein [Gemmatimonadales bacterium]